MSFDDREVLNNLNKFIQSQLPDVAFYAIKAAALEGEKQVKYKTPIDEGRLRASISSKAIKKLNGASGIVYTNVNYAVYVHEGTGIYAKDGKGRKTPWYYTDRKGRKVRTVGQRPKEYMTKGIESGLKEIQEAFYKGAKNAFR